MQPVVHATTRTPGPSTVEPVVNECRKPMSPVSSALCTSISGRSFARFTRISNGLAASRPMPRCFGALSGLYDAAADGAAGALTGAAGFVFAATPAPFEGSAAFATAARFIALAGFAACGRFADFARFADFPGFAALPGLARCDVFAAFLFALFFAALADRGD